MAKASFESRTSRPLVVRSAFAPPVSDKQKVFSISSLALYTSSISMFGYRWECGWPETRKAIASLLRIPTFFFTCSMCCRGCMYTFQNKCTFLLNFTFHGKLAGNRHTGTSFIDRQLLCGRDNGIINCCLMSTCALHGGCGRLH